MRTISWTVLYLVCVTVSCVHAGAEPIPPAGGSADGEQARGMAPETIPAIPGRFQLVVVPEHPGSPFLLDTASGCLWLQVQNEETKRTTFVEVDVENLHWGWGTGTQSLLAGRIEASQASDEQKYFLKENLRKSGCGATGVVLTPDLRPRLTQGSGDTMTSEMPSGEP